MFAVTHNLEATLPPGCRLNSQQPWAARSHDQPGKIIVMLRYVALRYIAFRNITLRYVAFRSVPLRSVAFRSPLKHWGPVALRPLLPPPPLPLPFPRNH